MTTKTKYTKEQLERMARAYWRENHSVIVQGHGDGYSFSRDVTPVIEGSVTEYQEPAVRKHRVRTKEIEAWFEKQNEETRHKILECGEEDTMATKTRYTEKQLKHIFNAWLHHMTEKDPYSTFDEWMQPHDDPHELEPAATTHIQNNLRNLSVYEGKFYLQCHKEYEVAEETVLEWFHEKTEAEQKKVLKGK